MSDRNLIRIFMTIVFSRHIGKPSRCTLLKKFSSISVFRYFWWFKIHLLNSYWVSLCFCRNSNVNTCYNIVFHIKCNKSITRKKRIIFITPIITLKPHTSRSINVFLVDAAKKSNGKTKAIDVIIGQFIVQNFSIMLS